MEDKLDICPRCGCDGCYVSPLNETKFNYFCWGCGFQTNDLLKVGEYDSEQYESAMPELYKDIKFVDTESRVWYPIVINEIDKGTVFINGKSSEKWAWAGILTRKLTEEELSSLSNKGVEYKSDPKTLKEFDKDFLSACEYIKII
jgi:hypothetical protein